MPRLPSSQDVQQVSPRTTADPGVRVPAQAFDSPLGAAAQELTPAVERFAQVALRQENRRDTVDRSGKINQFNLESDEELRRLNAEADLSSEEVLIQYGSFLDKRQQELLENHGGSQDSRAVLTMRLQDVAAASTGRAAALSTELGRAKVKTTFSNSLSPLMTRASQDPSIKNIDRLFGDLETNIDDLRGALDPSEEESFRSAAREEIVLSAIDPLIIKGRVETAASLIENGGLNDVLSPKTQRDIMRRIETVRFSRDEALKKKDTFDTLQPNEVKQLGFPQGTIVQRKSNGALNIVFEPSETGSVRAERIRSLTEQFKEQNIPEPERRAEDVVDGNTVVEVLESGQVRLVDKPKAVTGQPGAVKELPVSPAETVPRAKVPREETLFALAEEATGVRSQVLSITGRVPGTKIKESEAKVSDARSAFKLVQNDLARSLVFNERFPVKEREAVIEAFDIEPNVFDTPSAMRVRLAAMERFLTTRVEQFDRDISDPNLSPDVRSGQRANASAMKNAIDRIGVPQKEFFNSIKTVEDVKSLSGADVEFIISQATEQELDALPEEIRAAFADKLNAR